MSASALKPLERITAAEQTTKVFRLLKGLHATHLIYLGVELGFFRALAAAGAAGLTGGALAKRCSTVTRYTSIWCQAATAVELLDLVGPREGGTRDSKVRYRLGPHIDELFANEGRFYIGGVPRIHLQIARDYARYPELFKTGGTYPFQAHDDAFLSSITKGPRTQPRIFLEMILPKLPGLKQKLDRGGRILDLGCGGGQALVEFAKAFPESTCLGIDIHRGVITTAKNLIGENGLQARVKARFVRPDHDFSADGPYDLITTFLVVHEISPEFKEQAIRKAARSLSRGGHLLIFDDTFPESFDKLTSEPEIFGVMTQWFEAIWGNEISTRSELREMVSKAGLRIADETQFSRYYILTASKG